MGFNQTEQEIANAINEGDNKVVIADGNNTSRTAVVNSNGELLVADELPREEGSFINGAKGAGILCSDGTNFRWLKVDINGNLVTTQAPTANIFFRFGSVQSANNLRKAVHATTYTAQGINAQRSIASNNANDNSTGTGARTVRITYYTSAGTGPFTEIVTLNGTAYVNTSNSDICFIEEMRVMTVGSVGSNVGVITLRSATAGGGVTVGTIAANNNQTFWAHHYIPSGKIFKLTGISCGHNGTTVGSGGLFVLTSTEIGVSNVPEIQISDFVRLYGQSSTFSREYNSPIEVTGPAYINMYVTPESGSSFNYRGAFDFFEE